ncbi:MAG TPA: AMP-binding protein [Dehalococcoidia bacterium]|nr:AMP-binding protein [Dehalococcoidia bacterium]
MTSPNLPESLEQAARRFGLAYIEGSRRVTWAELALVVEATAAGLVALGLQKGDRVAICAENGIDWIAALQAVWRAGGAGVLVYYDLQPREIEEQVRRPGCRFLFASPGVLDKLGDGIAGVERVVVIAGPIRSTQHIGALAEQATPKARDELPSRAPAPDDLAVVVYTSGTTGGAKGVMLSHRNLISNAQASIEALQLTERDSSLLVLPMHHAMPLIAAVVLPPLVGAHFVIENDLRRIRDRLQEHKPTILFGVPALYELVYRNILARAEVEGRLKTLQRLQGVLGVVRRLTGVTLAPTAFRSVHKALGGKLRFLVSGGAALNPRTVLDFAGLGLPLLQGWGMTEASPVIAVQRFSARRFRYSRYYERHAGSVGAPIPGVEVRLIDVPEKQISVAEGGEGEVIVRGPNVFMGYWQAEAETQAALSEGWLRTGDLGRIDAEGNIYLTGRSKYVIVLESGEKVHPDELEEVLSQSDLLRDVCVTGRVSAERRDKTLVTAVVYASVDVARERATAAGTPLDEATLRRMVQLDVDMLGRQVAAYKRVSRVELSDAPLPKTPLQKVARGRLADSYGFDLTSWLRSGE